MEVIERTGKNERARRAPLRFEDLPDEAFVTASDIVRSRSGPGVVPRGRAKWREEVKAGRAPAPEYPYGPALPMWRVGAIRAYLRELGTKRAA